MHARVEFYPGNDIDWRDGKEPNVNGCVVPLDNDEVEVIGNDRKVCILEFCRREISGELRGNSADGCCIGKHRQSAAGSERYPIIQPCHHFGN
jgi:hypothetical protein